MKKYLKLNKFFNGFFLVPLTLQSGWEIESFSKIPANNVAFSKEGLSVKVNESASPLIYSFEKKKLIQGFKIEGEFRNLPQFKNVALQGTKGFDDYPLRIGFVIEGDKKLSFVERVVSPAWIKNIYSKLPEGLGLDHIQFYNVTQNKNQYKTSRTHPSSDLIRENFFELVERSGKFSYRVDFETKKNVLGLWISIDGDDTKSSYETQIYSLTLEE